jgi:hypothetical protein
VAEQAMAEQAIVEQPEQSDDQKIGMSGTYTK